MHHYGTKPSHKTKEVVDLSWLNQLLSFHVNKGNKVKIQEEGEAT